MHTKYVNCNDPADMLTGQQVFQGRCHLKFKHGYQWPTKRTPVLNFFYKKKDGHKVMKYEHIIYQNLDIYSAVINDTIIGKTYRFVTSRST